MTMNDWILNVSRILLSHRTLHAASWVLSQLLWKLLAPSISAIILSGSSTPRLTGPDTSGLPAKRLRSRTSTSTANTTASARAMRAGSRGSTCEEPCVSTTISAPARWAAATSVWAAVTQRFFGPPLIDRGFRLTGGACELLTEDMAGKAGRVARGEEVLSAVACKMAGGTWKGGHDISGHVFLLILGSSLLWFEFLPALTRAEGLRDGRRILLADGKVASVAVEKDVDADKETPTKQGVKFALGVAALMWWMLLMTAAYFHTWFEKFTGLLVAFSGLGAVYFLPRGLPGLRAVLGMPGV